MGWDLEIAAKPESADAAAASGCSEQSGTDQDRDETAGSDIDLSPPPSQVDFALPPANSIEFGAQPPDTGLTFSPSPVGMEGQYTVATSAEVCPTMYV